MLINLNKPSISEIKANLISEQLKNLPQSSSYINVFVTGRSTSGKTTLGNRLIGEDYFLSTGKQNTTQVVNMIDFVGGLRFFDPPGVDGGGRSEGGRLENYNRAALGMPQFRSYPNVTDITIATYKNGSSPVEHQYSIDEFKNLPFRPDIIFYLIAPTKQFSNYEKDYAIDLMESGYNVIYVLNIFSGQGNNKEFIGTQQNIDDAVKGIKEIYAEAKLRKQPNIVKVNCLTGEGIEGLLENAYKTLGDVRGAVFKKLVLMQYQKASEQYIDQVKQEIVKVFASVACAKPSNDKDVAEILNSHANLLWNYLADLSIGTPRFSYSDFNNKINQIIKSVAKNSKEDHYEEIFAEKSKKVYHDVAKYKLVLAQEDDIDNPIMRTEVVYTDPDLFEGIGNFLNRGEWKNKNFIQVHTGRFHKKTVQKQVFDKYVREFSHVERWTEATGKKKYSFSSYNHLSVFGISFLQVLAIGIVNGEWHDKSKFVKALGSYDSLLKKTIELNLVTKNQEPSKNRLLDVLKKNINIILDNDFDLRAKKILFGLPSSQIPVQKELRQAVRPSRPKTTVKPVEAQYTKQPSRRKMLKMLGLGGVGLVGSIIWTMVPKENVDASLSVIEQFKSVSDQATIKNLQSVSFKTVKLDAQGVITDHPISSVEVFKENLGNEISLTMVKIPGGSFMMGSPEGETGVQPSEKPQHQVTLKEFFLGQTEVTQAQYQAIMGENPSRLKGDNYPVENITWEQAKEFCRKLSIKRGKDYDLPSEAQWEYACRSETKTPFYFGETISADVANYYGKSNYGQEREGVDRGKITDVGRFPPNAFGLYDMHGNVWEWCADDWLYNYNSPRLFADKLKAPLRGGSWSVSPKSCRSASRFDYTKVLSEGKIGFRVICTHSFPNI